MSNQKMDRIVYHRPGKGWGNQNVDATKPEKYYPTQKDAYDAAKEIVGRNGGGEVIITRRDNGQIREKNTIPPGNDTYPPKG